MKSAGFTSFLATCVVSFTVSTHASDNTAGDKGWPLTIGEETPIVDNPTFVSDAPGATPPVETAAASIGNPAVEDVSDGSAPTGGGGGSPPSVPLPAPVVLAGIGLAGLILCRKRIGRLVR